MMPAMLAPLLATSSEPKRCTEARSCSPRSFSEDCSSARITCSNGAREAR